MITMGSKMIVATRKKSSGGKESSHGEKVRMTQNPKETLYFLGPKDSQTCSPGVGELNELQCGQKISGPTKIEICKVKRETFREKGPKSSFKTNRSTNGCIGLKR